MGGCPPSDRLGGSGGQVPTEAMLRGNHPARIDEKGRLKVPNGFRTPFYPVIPVVFCTMCGFMLWKAVAYVFNPNYGPKFGNLVLAGLLVMGAGIPLYWLARRK